MLCFVDNSSLIKVPYNIPSHFDTSRLLPHRALVLPHQLIRLGTCKKKRRLVIAGRRAVELGLPGQFGVAHKVAVDIAHALLPDMHYERVLVLRNSKHLC